MSRRYPHKRDCPGCGRSIGHNGEAFRPHQCNPDGSVTVSLSTAAKMLGVAPDLVAGLVLSRKIKGTWEHTTVTGVDVGDVKRLAEQMTRRP